MAVLPSTIPFEPRRKVRSVRQVIVEIVSQDDAQSDMTAAGDIHAGLGSEFDVHLIHLGDLANKLSRRAGVFPLAVDNPRFDEALTDILRSLRAEAIFFPRMRRTEDSASIANTAATRMFNSIPIPKPGTKRKKY